MKKLVIILFLLICFFAKLNVIKAEDEIIKCETKDKVLFIASDDNEFSYSWSFNKNEYKDDAYPLDFKIKFYTINKDRINNLIDEKIKKQFISFNYHGTLPSSATIKIPAINFKDNDRLNLYYYDEENGKIKQVETNLLVMNGYVSFDIDHCSDYFLTLSIVKEADSKNNSGIIIIGMIIVIVGLVGYTLFKGKK